VEEGVLGTSGTVLKVLLRTLLPFGRWSFVVGRCAVRSLFVVRRFVDSSLVVGRWSFGRWLGRSFVRSFVAPWLVAGWVAGWFACLLVVGRLMS